jgi:hypothetical protein
LTHSPSPQSIHPPRLSGICEGLGVKFPRPTRRTAPFRGTGGYHLGNRTAQIVGAERWPGQARHSRLLRRASSGAAAVCGSARRRSPNRARSRTCRIWFNCDQNAQRQVIRVFDLSRFITPCWNVPSRFEFLLRDGLKGEMHKCVAPRTVCDTPTVAPRWQKRRSIGKPELSGSE